jgi:outer membrane receptor for Fe3+-dicitrate
MNYILTGSMLSGDGYRDWSAYKGDNARGKFAFALSPKVKVTAILGWTDFYNQNPEGLNLDWFSSNPKVLRRQANPDSASKNEFQKTQRGTGGVTTSISLSENLDLTATAYYRNTRYAEAVPSTVIHRDLDTPGLMTQLNHRAAWGRFTNHLSAGLDYAWQAIDETKYPNLGGAVEGPDLVADQTLSQTGAGVFVLDRLEIGPHWGVSASARYERTISKPGEQTSPATSPTSGRRGGSASPGILSPTSASTPAGARAFSPRGPRSSSTTPMPSAATTLSSSPRPRAARRSERGDRSAGP